MSMTEGGNRNIMDFPDPIVRVIEALSDSQRRLILLHLHSEGELPWTGILERMELEKGTLNHHLNVLEAAAMIRNFSKEDPAIPYRSYYEITPVAKRVIDGIFGAFRPYEAEPARLSASALGVWLSTEASSLATGSCPEVVSTNMTQPFTGPSHAHEEEAPLPTTRWRRRR